MSKPNKPDELKVTKITIYVPPILWELIKILAYVDGETESKVIMNYLRRLRYVMMENVNQKLIKHARATNTNPEEIRKKALTNTYSR